MPLPAVFTIATIVVQLLGGAAVVLGGLGAQVGAALLAGFTIAATVLGHRFWLLQGASAQRELTTSLEHVAIVGGLLLLAVRPS